MMPDDSEVINVDPGAVIQVLNTKVANLTQANTLLEARILQLNAEKEAYENEAIKKSKEDNLAES